MTMDNLLRDISNLFRKEQQGDFCYLVDYICDSTRIPY